MLELKDQVCAFEQAKELDRLGMKAESYFIWASIMPPAVDDHRRNSINYAVVKQDHIIIPHDVKKYSYEYSGHAYTAGELGALLPPNFQRPELDPPYEYDFPTIYYVTEREEEVFVCGYALNEWNGSDDMWIQKKSLSEAHARADLLIQIIKQKLIKPEDLNL